MKLFQRFRSEPPWCWGLWLLIAVIWTILLVLPMPEEVRWPLTITGQFKFYLGKSLHVGMYALLTAFAGRLRPRLRWRLLLLFLLMAHAALTELAQTHVPGRTGKITDVVLDHAGILFGLVLSWKWWTRED